MIKTIQLHIARKNKNDWEFLILKRNSNEKMYPNIWQVVTGTCRKNESSIITAKRELYEETRLEPLKIWTIPYVTTFFNPYTNKVNFVPVFGVEVSYSQKVTLSKEHIDFKWLNLEQCINYLFLPSHKQGTKYFFEYCLNNDLSFNFLYNENFS